MQHENRDRELGYKALERVEDEQALRDRRALGERARRQREEVGRQPPLTPREREMRWPVD